MKLALCLVTLASACRPWYPPYPSYNDWHNPCVIDDHSATLAPQFNKICSFDFAGYLGKVIADRTIRQRNGQNVHAPLWDGWRPYYGNAWYRWNGLRYDNENNVRLAECSSYCVRHPDCTSFSFSSTSGAHWSTGPGGQCHLYRYCDYKATINYGGWTQWWLGSGKNDDDNKSNGEQTSNTGRCTDKSHLTKHCKNDGTCICPPGYESAPSDVDAVCAVCKWGFYKSGTNRNKCQAWSKPKTGQYIATYGSEAYDHVMGMCMNKPPNSMYTAGGEYPRMDEVTGVQKPKYDDKSKTYNWSGASRHNRRRLGVTGFAHSHPMTGMGMSGMTNSGTTSSMSGMSGMSGMNMMNMNSAPVVKNRVIGKGTCPFMCAPGYMKSNKDGSAKWSEDGTDCFKPGSTVTFKSSGSVGKVMSHANNVLTFHGFKCVDEPKFCGVDSSLNLIEKRIKALEQKVTEIAPGK